MKNFTRLFLLGLCVLTVMACNKYKKPGEFGTIPPLGDGLNEKMQVSSVIIEDEIIPTPMVCHTPYGYIVRASEVHIQCNGYSFKRLYDEAFQRMEDRKARLQCPSDCERLEVFVREQQATCYDTVATVIIHFGMVCLGSQDPPPAGLSRLNDPDLAAPFDQSSGISEPNIAEGFLPQRLNQPIECPGDIHIKIEFSQRISSCQDVKDYTPIMKRIYEQAKLEFSRIPCPEPCTQKRKPKFVAASWGCDNNRITVVGYLKAQCVK